MTQKIHSKHIYYDGHRHDCENTQLQTTQGANPTSSRGCGKNIVSIEEPSFDGSENVSSAA